MYGTVTAEATANDQVERRKVALPKNEGVLSQPSIPSLAHEDAAAAIARTVG
jgi:hypothetical protein